MKKTELSTGWLSPSGDFYPCGVYEHIGKAMEILNNAMVSRADEKLHDCGFVSISISQLGKRKWRIYWKTFLTDQQKNFLKSYFEDDLLTVDNLSKIRWEKENDYS